MVILFNYALNVKLVMSMLNEEAKRKEWGLNVTSNLHEYLLMVSLGRC